MILIWPQEVARVTSGKDKESQAKIFDSSNFELEKFAPPQENSQNISNLDLN